MTRIKGVPAGQAARTASPPPGRLGRTGAWCYGHRGRVLLGWIIGVIAIIAVASAAGSHFRDEFSGVGQSGQASSILAQRFPAQAGDAAQVVFHSSAPIRSPGVTARAGRALAAIRTLPSVTSVSPLVTARDGHTALSTAQFDAIGAKIPAGDVKAVIATAESYAEPGLQVALGGPPISAVVSPSPVRPKGSGSARPSSSCWWPSARWSRWACPSSPPWPGWGPATPWWP